MNAEIIIVLVNLYLCFIGLLLLFGIAKSFGEWKSEKLEMNQWKENPIEQKSNIEHPKQTNDGTR